MRILHVSYSRAGGIGNVVSELVQAQILQGHSVEWDFVTSGPLRKEFSLHPIETIRAGFDDYVLRSPNFQGPISSLRLGRSLMKRVASRLDTFDVVHFHGGTLDLGEIANKKTHAKVVVSHHDMRLVTGACHQSMGCNGFQTGCPNCPALRSHFRHRAEEQRSQFFPSEWSHTAPSPKFADVLRESSLLGAIEVEIVPNPLPKELVEFNSGGKNDEFLTIIGSSAPSLLRNLSTDILANLESLAKKHNLKLVSIGGNVYDPRYVKNLGPLSREKAFNVMSRSQICITPSKFESFSTAGLEAIYLGSLLIAPLDSPQGELAESLNLRMDSNTEALPSGSNRLKQEIQQLLIEKCGIESVIHKLHGIYLG